MLRARPRRFTRVALLLAAGTGAAFAAEPTNPVGTPPADEPARAAVSAPPPPDAAASELPGEAPGGALSHWALPPPGACDPAGGLRGWPPGEDAPPLPFRPGDSFALEQLERLKDYLPEALFAQRERFFYEGMRLVIGSCFAD